MTTNIHKRHTFNVRREVAAVPLRLILLAFCRLAAQALSKAQIKVGLHDFYTEAQNSGVS